MAETTSDPSGDEPRDLLPADAEVPELPAVLLLQWPVIFTIAAGWVVAVVLAFTVPSLHDWRPVSLAGLGVGLLGTSIFLMQRRSARRGDRGAQRGLN